MFHIQVSTERPWWARRLHTFDINAGLAKNRRWCNGHYAHKRGEWNADTGWVDAHQAIS